MDEKKKNQEVRKEAKMNLASWFPLRLKRLVNRQNPLSFKRRHYQLCISWLPPNSLQKHHNDLFLIISFGNRHPKWNQGKNFHNNINILSWSRRRSYDSFFLWLSTSRSQVVIKSNQMTAFLTQNEYWETNDVVLMNSSSFWIKKLPLDNFLMMNREQEVENQMKKEPLILCPSQLKSDSSKNKLNKR